MTSPRPERPQTAAGRRILDDPVVFMPHSKEWARQCIVAAEAEAAAPYREALRELVAAWFIYSDNVGRKDVTVRLSELDTFHALADKARLLLEGKQPRRPYHPLDVERMDP